MWTLLPLLLLGQSPTITPYWQKEPLSIGSAKVVDSAKAGESVELAVDAHATFDNPFDPDDVALDAKITPPKGDAYTVPGFYERAYRLDGTDVRQTNDKGWRVRFYPAIPGSYKIDLALRDRSGSSASSTTVHVSDRTNSAAIGMVRLSHRDRRYFETESGRAFYPIGANVCWSEAGNLGDYQKWLSRYGAQGANWARIWLGPGFVMFALEVKGKPEEGKGLGVFDQRNAARVDQALDIARKNGLYLQLCIESFNSLRDRDNNNFWEQTPHNRENGGPLRIWTDFWTSPVMARLFKAKLRYLVARYAADPSVFAWEFWNEVDVVRNYDPEVVRAWHERMGKALKALDPYNHLVTTSFGNSNGERAIDLLPDLDFVQTHYYGQDPGGQAAWQQTKKSSWNKAHFVGEIGADVTGPRVEDDRRGLQIHDPIWSSIATGSSGGAMPWNWDHYIDPLNLYPLFGAAHRFVEGIDWPGEGFRQTRPAISYANPPKTPRRKDVVLSDGPISWEPGAANRPATIRFANGKLSGNLPVAGIQHGIVNHADLHNPVRFNLALSAPIRLVVEVGMVSGHGGAKLAISIDGNRVMTRDFADTDSNKTNELTQYEGAYGVDVPAGNHTVTVENLGTDWFFVSYRLAGLLVVKTPPVVSYAVTGERTALVWLRSEDAIWRNEAVLRKRPTPIPATILRLAGLSAGRWTVEHWDTWSGRRTRSQSANVGVNGVLRIELPSIPRDEALKITKK